MSTTNTTSVPSLHVDPDKLGFFRYGRLTNGWVLTNEHVVNTPPNDDLHLEVDVEGELAGLREAAMTVEWPASS